MKALPPHPAIAEQGKLHALAERHEQALLHYRLALRLAVAAGAPEVCVRHYVDCCMDSLELSGDLDAVLGYADCALALYDERSPQHPLQWRDLAALHERRAAVLLKSGRREEAAQACAAAIAAADRIEVALPLARQLQRWCDPRCPVDAGRVQAEQRRHHTFVVRRDSVDRSRARPVPPASLLGQMPSFSLGPAHPARSTP